MGSSAGKRIVVAVVCVSRGRRSPACCWCSTTASRRRAAVNQGCGDGQTSGCEEVARSSWSSFAGFPVAASASSSTSRSRCSSPWLSSGPWGTADPLAGLVVAALALGLLVDLLLLGVQAFAIKAYCKLCIATYPLSAARSSCCCPARRAREARCPRAGRPEGRLAFAGWALGTLAVAGAVFAADARSAPRRPRQANLLGAPAAPPPPRPPPPPPAAPAAPGATRRPARARPPAPAGPQDEEYWREQAQRLQETLDDPRSSTRTSPRRPKRSSRRPPVPIDVGAPGPGTGERPVKVVGYSDFMCPFCRNLGAALSQYVPQSGGRVAVYSKNYPLDTAAIPSCGGSSDRRLRPRPGGICAKCQGKLDAYHDRVFGTELQEPPGSRRRAHRR